jgi:hypothetical protein
MSEPDATADDKALLEALDFQMLCQFPGCGCNHPVGYLWSTHYCQSPQADADKRLTMFVCSSHVMQYIRKAIHSSSVPVTCDHCHHTEPLVGYFGVPVKIKSL